MKRSNYSSQHWDDRADAWEKVRLDKGTRKDDDRINDTVNFLLERGLLHPNFKVADIGCGPGRFAVAFAKHAEQVIGFDISEKMIQYGKEHAERHDCKNVKLLCCDFNSLDLNKDNYNKAFDLVFSSLTPAIHDEESLKKSIAMSKGYCCNITHISGSSQLEMQISRELFHRESPPRWNDSWFCQLSDMLKQLGYEPELSYYHRHQEKHIRPDEAYLDLLIERLLHENENSEKARSLIGQWLENHKDPEGLILDIRDVCYGRTVWSVNP